MGKIIVSAVVFLSMCYGCSSTMDDFCDENLQKVEQQVYPLIGIATENNNIPRTINEDGSVKFIKDVYDWTEGFWPGTCWMLYKHTANEEWKNEAIRSENLFLAHKDLTNDHDLGFIFNNSFGKGYEITGEEIYKDVLLDASIALSTRFNPTVGCIQSWDVKDNWQEKRGWSFPVIVDNMMNLEMLFEAAKLTGNKSYYEIAITHANTTMKNHFRADASSFHVVDYNAETGEVNEKVTAQGYADESAWARGQAWGLYGFTMCYRYTKDKTYLDFAQRIANFIFSHPNYPEDGVPYWDFNAPNIPDAKRDASAGAIMASALLELSDYTDGQYMEEAEHILKSLSSDRYLAQNGENGHFAIKHNVGSLPHGNEVDVPLNYSDYYYIEALLRLKTRR